MESNIYDYVLMLIPLAVGVYTMSYARWLWQKKLRRGAVGVFCIALFAVIYPGIVLFLVHV